MCAELCLQRQYKTHGEVKGYVNMEHLAGLLNLEYQVKISIQTIIKPVLPAKVRAMKPQ